MHLINKTKLTSFSLSSDHFQLFVGLQYCKTSGLLLSLSLITIFFLSATMAPKENSKKKAIEESTVTPTQLELDHIPIVDSIFKVVEAKCEFYFYELHLWLKQNYLNQQGPIRFWESLLPFYRFPKTHEFPNLISWCQAKYDLVKRVVMAQNGDILITISAQTITEMLLVPQIDSLTQLSPTTLMDLYHKLTFP